MNDNASKSDYSGTAYSIFTLNSHKVYINNLKEWLLKGVLLTAEKTTHFPRDRRLP